MIDLVMFKIFGVKNKSIKFNQYFTCKLLLAHKTDN